MQKEDIQWAVLGILILLVVAFVIKPVVTGQPVNLGLPHDNGSPEYNGTMVSETVTTSAAQKPTATPVPTTKKPTATPTWNKAVQTIKFVNPATYGENLTESIPNATKLNGSSSAIRDTNMTTYARFSGKYSGATQVMKMPFPYWELWYTVEPVASSLQAPAASSEGSYSTAMPTFSIEVMDADDPNRIVRTITPPGGIDPSLWTDKETDPRPWKEKFFEGQRSYYFVIQTHLLSSYSIEIKVPTSYVGKY